MDRNSLIEMFNEIQEKRGRSRTTDEGAILQEIGFRSLDFSELALRVERGVDRELSFNAASLRQIRTLGDVLDFLSEAANIA